MIPQATDIGETTPVVSDGRIRVTHAGLVVKEVTSYENPRIYGASNPNTFSDGIRVLRTILAERISPVGKRCPQEHNNRPS